jgi:hypothetical protein
VHVSEEFFERLGLKVKFNHLVVMDGFFDFFIFGLQNHVLRTAREADILVNQSRSFCRVMKFCLPSSRGLERMTIHGTRVPNQILLDKASGFALGDPDWVGGTFHDAPTSRISVVSWPWRELL